MSKVKRAYTIVAIPYWLVLRRPINPLSTKRENVPVGEIPADPTKPEKGMIDFRTLVQRFIKSLSKFINIEEESAGLKADTDTVNDSIANELRCVLQSGKYGYSAELYDITSRGKNGHREKTHCELLPFACRFAFSSKRTDGILVIEKFGPHSIVGILERAFEQFLRSNGYLEWKVDFRPISSRNYIEQHLNYTASTFNLLGRQIPKDLVSVVGAEKLGKEYEAEVEFRVKLRHNSIDLKKLINRIKSRKGDGIKICDTQFDGVSAELPIAGKKRKVYLNDLDNFLLQLDVSDEVKFDNGGHPTATSFYEAAKEGLEIAKKEIGGWDND